MVPVAILGVETEVSNIWLLAFDTPLHRYRYVGSDPSILKSQLDDISFKQIAHHLITKYTYIHSFMWAVTLQNQ